MYTLGHDFQPSDIHAGGLRYHGAGSIVSQLMKDGLIEAQSMPQVETLAAGVLFAQTEGIIPAPESTHAIAATIREALKAKEEGVSKTILFNLSGNGVIDLYAYEQYPLVSRPVLHLRRKTKSETRKSRLSYFERSFT